ncbi:MAG: DUF721 domain-containing protein [Paludibacteraceae bacterium]|nr:DUF721 domain-containing protein [Paludibacteraceae bacterium]
MNHAVQPIGDLVTAFLRSSGLEQPLLEQRLIRLWPQVVGQMAAEMTTRLEIRQGVLYAYMHSAALKNQLFQCRFQLVKKLNETVGSNVIHDIRLLG